MNDLPVVQRHASLPACVSLTISFNDHAAVYEPVAEWVADEANRLDWVSDQERQNAIATDSVWVCQWYPRTPVGFRTLAASSFETLMAALRAEVQP